MVIKANQGTCILSYFSDPASESPLTYHCELIDEDSGIFMVGGEDIALNVPTAACLYGSQPSTWHFPSLCLEPELRPPMRPMPDCKLHPAILRFCGVTVTELRTFETPWHGIMSILLEVIRLARGQSTRLLLKLGHDYRCGEG